MSEAGIEWDGVRRMDLETVRKLKDSIASWNEFLIRDGSRPGSSWAVEALDRAEESFHAAWAAHSQKAQSLAPDSPALAKLKSHMSSVPPRPTLEEPQNAPERQEGDPIHDYILKDSPEDLKEIMDAAGLDRAVGGTSGRVPGPGMLQASITRLITHNKVNNEIIDFVFMTVILFFMNASYGLVCS